MSVPYARYATACLAITVVAGVWMRIVLIRPDLSGPFVFQNAIHAHSHVALFGWTTMAIMALMLRAAGPRERRSSANWTRWHPHLLGVASLVAFVAFLQSGYVLHTIVLATLHVALWVVFAMGCWRRLDAVPPVERRLWRGALALLMVAGAGAMVPGPVRVLGVTDPWLLHLSVELFLTPFIQGWLGLAVAGVIYGQMARPHFAGWVFRLLVIGSLPAALFRSADPPPAAWPVLVGRAATVMVGVAALLLALDMLREARERRLTPLLVLGALALAAKGVAEVAAGAGVGIALLANRQLVIAYLHLVLLGVVTPVLLDALVARSRVPLLTVVQGVGLVITLAGLGTLGVPWLPGPASALGLTARDLLAVTLVGGVMSALGILGVLGTAGVRARSHTTTPPG